MAKYEISIVGIKTDNDWDDFVINLRDVANKDFIDCEKVVIPPNIKTGKRANRVVLHRLNKFMAECYEIGLQKSEEGAPWLTPTAA